jgi:hypothetical protein
MSVEEEAEPAGEVIDIEAAVQTAFDIVEAVGQGER